MKSEGTEYAGILELKGITKQFSGLTAVNDVSFSMKKRTIHALIGPNGAGKTTTVNMITGVYPQTKGTIFYAGQCLDGLKTFERARQGIGRTFQNLKLFRSMSVRDNLMVGGHQLSKVGLWTSLLNFSGSRNDEKILGERAEQVMEEIGMTEYMNANVNNLSYGRQKMTDLGRALMTRPKLLLLDEPAAGLIPSERKAFVDIILKLFESGIDIFLIEHNMDVVMNISTYITVLNFGEKIAEGKPVEIQNNDTVIKAYLGDQFRRNNQSAEGGDACAEG